MAANYVRPHRWIILQVPLVFQVATPNVLMPSIPMRPNGMESGWVFPGFFGWLRGTARTVGEAAVGL